MRFFPHAYVINLKRRPDRWMEVERQLRTYLPENIEPVRIEAIDAKEHGRYTGEQALCHSVLKVIDTILQNQEEGQNGDWVMILEDDVRLHKQFKMWFGQLHNSIDKMPTVPVFIYMGANQYHLRNHAEELKKMKDATELSFVASNSVTMGGYAILYNVHALLTVVRPIIQRHAQTMPYDHILSKKIPVSSLYSHPVVCRPNLMIPDVRDSDLRAKRDMVEFARTRQFVLDDYDIAL